MRVTQLARTVRHCAIGERVPKVFFPFTGIGSGSPYALAAARALIDIPDMTALQIGDNPRLDPWEDNRIALAVGCGSGHNQRAANVVDET